MDGCIDGWMNWWDEVGGREGVRGGWVKEWVGGWKDEWVG